MFDHECSSSTLLRKVTIWHSHGVTSWKTLILKVALFTPCNIFEMCIYSAANWNVMGPNSVADYLMKTTGVMSTTLIFLVHTEKCSNCKKLNMK